MKKTRTLQSRAAKFLTPALALFMFTQCNPEDPKMEEQISAKAETEIAAENASAMSLTIDGVHTVITTLEDCKTCDFVIPENATEFDGKARGVKPGQAICLEQNLRYGNLRLINLEGTEDKPIVIAYGTKEAEQTAIN